MKKTLPTHMLKDVGVYSRIAQCGYQETRSGSRHSIRRLDFWRITHLSPSCAVCRRSFIADRIAQ